MSETEESEVSYRKQIRQRVALLTGLMVMRRELDDDITEITGQIRHANAEEQKHLEQPVKALLPAASPDQNGTVRKYRMTDEQRKRKSIMMKAHWKAFHNGNGAAPASAEAIAPPPAVKKKLGRPGKEYSSTRKPPIATKKASHHTNTPIIGFGTNSDFIYQFAVSRQGNLNFHEVKEAARKSVTHKNLIVGCRLSVALAEMKRKGFLVHTGAKGTYQLTRKAVEVRQREEKGTGSLKGNER